MTSDTGAPNANDDELLACPFCGEVPEIVETIHESYNLIHRCDLLTNAIKIERFERASVREDWNTRKGAPSEDSQ